MEISKDGFTTKHVEINIAANQTLTKNETIMPVSQVINDFRVVLTWGEQPRDLDSHLTRTTSRWRWSFPYRLWISTIRKKME